MTSPRLHDDVSEETPLLQDDHILSRPDIENTSDSLRERPLPVMQIALLCYARMIEPIAFFSVFPFIAAMVKRNGDLPDSDVGFYSGIIESIFSAAQTLVLIFWGRLADKIGRKPVLIYSLCGTAVCPALFGVATSIPQMMLFRCLGGVFSGSGLIIRTMIADHTTPETQATAFSWFAFASNIGIFLGPIIGGSLADPAAQYPGVFGDVAFFENYPYALPGFVIGALTATGILTSMLFLEETLERAEADDARTANMISGAMSPDSNNQQRQNTPKMTIYQLVKAPGVAAALWVYSHVMLLAFAFTAVLPVVLFTPVVIGGFGCSPLQISIYMAAQGASQAVWLLVAFPLLQRRLGTKGSLRLCAAAYPFYFASFIAMNWLLRDNSETATVVFWVVVGIAVLIGPGVSMAFTGVQLALNDVSPAAHLLGTLNAIALTCTSAIRSIVPGLATAVFAVGVRYQIFQGQLVWVILIPMSIALLLGLKWLQNDK